MNKYEIMFIVKTTIGEEAAKKIVENLEKVLTEGNSSIISKKEMGQRELAYEINKDKTGYYFLYNVEANKDVIKEFDRLALINENVIRHLIINLDKE